VSLLGEKLTTGAVAGLILIAVGAWLATGRQRQTSTAERSRAAATSELRHHSPAAASRSSSPDGHNRQHA
jgi:hypothetical protein